LENVNISQLSAEYTLVFKKMQFLISTASKTMQGALVTMEEEHRDREEAGVQIHRP
jgi:hypothetical protein